MDSIQLEKQNVEISKQIEELKFRTFLQEQYSIQAMQWRINVIDCLSGLTKNQALNLTMADFQPTPVNKFVSLYLDSKEKLTIYMSMEHILPTAKKYEDELNFIINNYKNYKWK
jgi:hypothetical protein